MKQKAVSEGGLWRGKKGILGEDRRMPRVNEPTGPSEE